MSKELSKKMLKTIPVWAIILSASLVTASVLTYFAFIEGSVTVHQSVVFSDGSTEKTFSFNNGEIVAGDTFIDTVGIKNRAKVPVNVKFETLCYGTDPEGNTIDCEGITTTYLKLSSYEETVIEKPLSDFPRDENYELKVIVTYNPDRTVTFRMVSRGNLDKDQRTSGVFTFDVNSDGIADFQVEIFPEGLGETQYKEYDIESKTWVQKDMPTDFIATYGTTEEYEWRQLTIPVSVLGGYGSEYKFGAQINIHVNELVNPENTGWIYQTFPDVDDLWGARNTTYPWGSSTNYYSVTVGEEIPEGEPFTIGSKETVNFFIKNDFAISLAPGTYTIVTQIVPVGE